jgi:NAD(P)-dependent dehydrogenase (short-subunit alcohol dehydrogenase family)
MPNSQTIDIPSQAGKLAIVTGANSGIGYETALELSRAGAEVILAGRSEAKGRDAVQRILREVPVAKVRFGKADLANLASIAEFADRVLSEGRPIDLLVNNAGVMAYPTRKTTADGFEAQFGTNHLGHFALTGRLLPLLYGGHRSRVVNVSSLAHRQGRIRFDDLQTERNYKPWTAYTQSKLANLLFTFELQRRSDAGGWGLMSNAAHPGWARTEIIANGPGSDSLLAKFSARFAHSFGHSSLGGAMPTLFAATSLEAKPNGYYGPKGFYELKGPVAPAFIAPQAKDISVARTLWEVSVELTGVSWPAHKAAYSEGATA